MTHRPIISPDVLAAIISAAPERLQKKLDREPRAADRWEWAAANGQWSVNAGEETVRIPAGVISDLAQVMCSCLLSPRCFHVLAVLNVAEIAALDEMSSDGAVEPGGETAQGDEGSVEPVMSKAVQQEARDSEEQPAGASQSLTEVQQDAAGLMFDACAGILATGLRAAGALLQSRLLRAIYECRSEGLHRIAAGGLRLMNDLRQLRDSDDQFSSAAAEADFREVLESCMRVRGFDNTIPASRNVAMEWIGVARRSFQPITSLKLHALFCEPILTRSGFSGVVTWLMSDDGWVGTVSDVQPGNAKRIPQAWQSGVSLAGLSISHRDLSQKSLLISIATKTELTGIRFSESPDVLATKWLAASIGSRASTTYLQLAEWLRQLDQWAPR